MVQSTTPKPLVLPSGHSQGPGDEIVVLPKADVKSLQLAKDITQILYQIAIATRVAVDF